MKLVISQKQNVQKFVNIFKLLKGFCGDVNLVFHNDMMSLQCMDQGHISLCELGIHASWFDTYDCHSEHVLGINTGIFGMILDCFEPGHSIVLEFNQGDEELNIKLMSIETEEEKKDEHEEEKDGKKTKGKGKKKKTPEKTTTPSTVSIFDKEFSIPLMEIDYEHLSVPTENPWTADIKIQSDIFLHIINEMSKFSETAEITATEEIFNITTKGENGKYNVKLDITKIDEYSIAEEEELKLSYNMKFLNQIAGLSKITEHTYVHLSENMPMRIQYGFGDIIDPEEGEEEVCSVSSNAVLTFYLAPKIIDD